ncbi:MAG: sigma-54-dependent Fis family transcriptional regulator, partial [Acidobacteria bacterium]|nr:sigma-54-dependent Fis family transcriptional regulator [Acidobacteriota bacterium]
RAGLFEAAHRGTLFLDEAGEMSLNLQAKLLRVLTDGLILRVGATTPRAVDVRIIVATHRNLRERVAAGQFREDLYYRLAVVPLDVPPLRERRGDIPVLVDYLLKETSRELKVPLREIEPEAIAKLRDYEFPGNVRELRNLVERANILAPGPRIGADDFFLHPAEQKPTAAAGELPAGLELPKYLEQIERGLITKALREAGGVQAEAARRLGISRSDIAYKIKKYGLSGS